MDLIRFWEEFKALRKRVKDLPEEEAVWRKLLEAKPPRERWTIRQMDRIEAEARAAATAWIESGVVRMPAESLRARHRIKAVFAVVALWERASAVTEMAPAGRAAWLAMIPKEASLLIGRIERRLNLAKP